MSLSLLIALVLLLLALIGVFGRRLGAAYELPGDILATLCIVLLFLIAVGVFHG